MLNNDLYSWQHVQGEAQSEMLKRKKHLGWIQTRQEKKNTRRWKKEEVTDVVNKLIRTHELDLGILHLSYSGRLQEEHLLSTD